MSATKLSEELKTGEFLDTNINEHPDPWQANADDCQADVLDIDRLVATVKAFHGRTNKLLDAKGEGVKRELQKEMFDLGSEIAKLSEVLAYAVGAQDILSVMSNALFKKAKAYADVFGDLPYPDPEAFYAQASSMGPYSFGIGEDEGERFIIPF